MFFNSDAQKINNWKVSLSKPQMMHVHELTEVS